MFDDFWMFSKNLDLLDIIAIYDLDDNLADGISFWAVCSTFFTHSLETANHFSSGIKARARIGKDDRTSSLSSLFCAILNCETRPSSLPVIK
jgi:hypothetical protein